MDNNNLNVTPNDVQQAESAFVQRVQSGVDSVSVDGLSTKYQSLDQQIKGLQELARLQAARNPLGCLKIFEVRSGR